MSIFGGIAMLYILYNNDKMWTSTNMLIGNLAIASTCVALLVMPFSLFTAAKRAWVFGEGRVCKLTGFSASLLLLVTIFTHTVISIDKYYAVVKPMSRAMTTKRTAVSIFAIWVIATAISLGPLAGISRYDYNPTTLICGIGFPKNKLDLLYLVGLSSVGFIIPINIMTYVYMRVYVAVKQHTARLLAHAVMSTEVLVLQKKLILTVFFSLVCFLLCWSTFCALTITAVIIEDRSELPRGLGIAAYWTGYLNSALNPVIICSMSVRFKEGLVDIFKRFINVFACAWRRRSKSLTITTYESADTWSYQVQYKRTTSLPHEHQRDIYFAEGLSPGHSVCIKPLFSLDGQESLSTSTNSVPELSKA
eukprot:gene3403-3893_t